MPIKSATKVYRPDTDTWRKLVKTFGRGILAADNTIDRKKLGAIVFSNEEELKRLNAIVHPQITEIIKKQIDDYRRKDAKVIVLDAAGVIGSTCKQFNRWSLGGSRDDDNVIKRAVARQAWGKSKSVTASVLRCLKTERIKNAQVIIYNDGTPEDLRGKIKNYGTNKSLRLRLTLYHRSWYNTLFVEGTNIYAIIETGGKQYRVIQGQTVDVDNLNVIDGEAVELDKVLVIGDEKNATIVSPILKVPKLRQPQRVQCAAIKSLSTNSNQRSDSARRPDIINFSHAWRLTKSKLPGLIYRSRWKRPDEPRKRRTKVAHKKGGGKSKNGRDVSRNASALRNMPGK